MSDTKAGAELTCSYLGEDAVRHRISFGFG